MATALQVLESLRDWDTKFPRAGDTVDGREVLPDTPNLSSISASLTDYTVLRGIREVPMAEFTTNPKAIFYAADDFARSRRLAARIQETNTISPLIVVVDREGPYLLEGHHRFVALLYLHARSFPAVVVIDEDAE